MAEWWNTWENAGKAIAGYQQREREEARREREEKRQNLIDAAADKLRREEEAKAKKAQEAEQDFNSWYVDRTTKPVKKTRDVEKLYAMEMGDGTTRPYWRTEQEEQEEAPDPLSMEELDAEAARRGVFGSESYKALTASQKAAYQKSKDEAAAAEKERNYQLRLQAQAALAEHRKNMQSIARARVALAQAKQKSAASRNLEAELKSLEDEANLYKSQIKNSNFGFLPSAEQQKILQAYANSLTQAQNKAIQVKKEIASQQPKAPAASAPPAATAGNKKTTTVSGKTFVLEE